MPKMTIRDVDLRGKKTLVRADFNVTFRPGTTDIADDSRIRATLPTISYLLEQGARVILCSHLGRPKGVQDELRLAPVAQRLSELLGIDVPVATDCIGPEAEAMVSGIADGGVGLLENLRFHSEEEENDTQFAQALAALAEVYVNDAFGTAHRAHASTEGVAHVLPAVSGFLLAKEIESLGAALESPDRPFAAVLGGAKVSDKMAVLQNLIPKVTHMLIGGGMAAAFLNAYGHSVGKSLMEEGGPDMAREIVRAAAREGGVELLLPLDVVVAKEMSADASAEAVFTDSVPDDAMILDIGPRTADMYRDALADAQTVLWNGPMGAFEFAPFSAGTRAVAEAMAEATDKGAVTLLGGGSTAEAVDALGLTSRMTHVSTGGGASLEFLEGKTLPGVAALQDA